MFVGEGYEKSQVCESTKMTNNETENRASIELPTILIVGGAWHIPKHYESLVLQLRSRGYTVDCPRLPTTSGTIPPTCDVNDDADFIRKVAIQHLEQGKNIVALLHSYGGSIGTRAFAGLGRNDRNAPGDASVLRLIYLTACAPGEDDPPSSGPRTPSPYEDHSTVKTDGMVRLYKDLAPKHFYGDCSQESVAHAMSMLVPMPACFLDQLFTGTKPLAPAYKTIPTTYIVCEQDGAIPSFVQDMMIENIKRVMDNGVHLTIVRLDCSHSPFVSRPEEIAGLIEESIKGTAA